MMHTKPWHGTIICGSIISLSSNDKDLPIGRCNTAGPWADVGNFTIGEKLTPGTDQWEKVEMQCPISWVEGWADSSQDGLGPWLFSPCLPVPVTGSTSPVWDRTCTQLKILTFLLLAGRPGRAKYSWA